MSDKPATRHQWTRRIAVGMAVVTGAAILAAFSSEYLGMHWLAPAAQIIILAEILGFVVLERFQVFEPVQETIAEVRGRLESLEGLRSELAASGYALAASDVESTHQRLADLLKEAIAKKPASPQVLRVSLLSGNFVEGTEAAAHAPQYAAAVEGMRAFVDTPQNRAQHPWVTSWAVRTLIAIGDRRSFESAGLMLTSLGRSGHTNQVVKLLPRAGAQAAIAPSIVGDQAVALGLEENSLAYPHWGVIFQGEQYAALFARWFDEVWQDPEAITLFARGVFDEPAFERLRQRLVELGVPLSTA